MNERPLGFDGTLAFLARFEPEELVLLNREDAKDTKEEE